VSFGGLGASPWNSPISIRCRLRERLPRRQSEIAGIDALIADPASRARDGTRRKTSARRSRRAASELRKQIRVRGCCPGAIYYRNVVLESAAGRCGLRARAFCRRPFGCMSVFACQKKGAGSRAISMIRSPPWVASRRSSPQCAPRSSRQAEIRILGAPGTARARHLDAGPHPHLGGERCLAAGCRGFRCRHQAVLFADRDHALAGRRRSASLTDRIGDPHHPHSDRHRVIISTAAPSTRTALRR